MNNIDKKSIKDVINTEYIEMYSFLLKTISFLCIFIEKRIMKYKAIGNKMNGFINNSKE